MVMSAFLKKYKVSVVIPTYNEEKDIGDLMECLCKQTFKDFEVIVVDNFSNDNTLNIVKKYRKRLKIRVYKRRGNVSFARNFGFKKASGEIMVFLDADIVVPKDFIEKIYRSFYPDAVCVSLFGTKGSIFDIIHKEGISSIPIAFKKKSFFKVGGFDEALSAFEDLDLTERIESRGLIKVLNKNIVIYHKFPQKLKELYRQQKKWGMEYLKYLEKKRKKKIVYLLPFFLFVLILKKLFFFYGFLISSLNKIKK